MQESFLTALSAQESGRLELFPTVNKEGNFRIILSELPGLKVIVESSGLSSQTPYSMLTEERAMILEGLAHCPENTPVTLVLRIKQTNEVGDFRDNYWLQPKSFWILCLKIRKILPGTRKVLDLVLGDVIPQSRHWAR